MAWSNLENGSEAQLLSSDMYAPIPVCMTFWYFIVDPQTFGVYLSVRGSFKLIWSKPSTDSKPQPWTEARVDIEGITVPYQVNYMRSIRRSILLYITITKHLSIE